MSKLKSSGSKSQTFYPLGDRPTRGEFARIGWKGTTNVSEDFNIVPTHHCDDGTILVIAARATGETRSPKAGEWYLSGAPENVHAYRCAKTSSSRHVIARLVVLRKQMVVKFIGDV